MLKSLDLENKEFDGFYTNFKKGRVVTHGFRYKIPTKHEDEGRLKPLQKSVAFMCKSNLK